MGATELNVVTGAFGFTGKYITRRLLSMGKSVLTLTGHPKRENPFGDRLSVALFNYDNPARLTESLRGAATLYNTYWVRFPYRGVGFQQAVDNSETLIRAAEEAGVRRIVHISIANASEESALPYLRGKGVVEGAIMRSSLSNAIIRPTVIFGLEDILINNIAWLLRRFPVFAVPGTGNYCLQPVFVEDVAEIAVSAGQEAGNLILDAVGPETFTFEELVRLIAEKVQARARVIHVRPGAALLLLRLLSCAINDVVLTREEVSGLMANLLVSESPSTGRTRLGDWLDQNAASVGIRYASELKRHYR